MRKMNGMTKSRSEQIFDHAQKFATPFRTSLGQPWAIVPDGPDRYRGFPIMSRGFEHWLSFSFHTEHNIFPGASALESAIRMFAAHASHSEFPVSDVFTRVGWRGDRRLPQSVLLHLANSRNELVEITASGHRIISAESWHFMAWSPTLPLQRPVDSNVTLRDHLQALINIDGAALDRTVLWLFAALRPGGPYPIMVISGPPASGKSILARILRHLIDPNGMSVLTPPANDRELFHLGLHNYILPFDHVSSLPRSVSDSLARLAGGAGMGICGNNVLDAPEPLPLSRPIIVTASSGRGSSLLNAFSNNCIHVELAAIKPENMRTESELAQMHHAAVPAILGTLCAGITAALCNQTTTQTTSVSRFADVHQWALSAAPILGLTPEQINRALAANPLVDALEALLEHQSAWSGTASDLLDSLRVVGYAGIAGDARHLSEQLNSTPLSLFGLVVERSSSHDEHLITVRRQSTEISLRKSRSRSTSHVQ